MKDSEANKYHTDFASHLWTKFCLRGGLTYLLFLLLFQSLGDSTRTGVLNQLLPMIKSPSQRTSDDYGPEELLILLIYIYSVTGELTMDKDLSEAEERVKKALAHVLSEESELSPLLQKITGEWGAPYRTHILWLQKASFWVRTSGAGDHCLQPPAGASCLSRSFLFW